MTSALLSGFMIGSLNKIWPWKLTVETFTDSDGIIRPLVQENIMPGKYFAETGSDPMLLWSILLALAGFGLIIMFEGFPNKEGK